jgi:uncharacterized membrane protein YraQ (UPF0718 family)
MENMLLYLTEFIRETWWLTAEMAPYLILGFAIAGLLRVFFTEDWVRRHLGQKGLRQILKAVVIGIPLPLCSCGVIPVAAGIRRQGGERGAVAAFTAATPQTGVDAIAATVGMLGWVFTVVRVCIAFVNGIVAGLIVERLSRTEDPDGQMSKDEGPKSCCSEQAAPAESSCCANTADPIRNPGTSTFDLRPSSIKAGLKFGLLTLPRDLFGALVVGLFIAGAIAAFAPADLFTGLPGGQFGLYVAMTLISLPLYVCSTGSIPMAYSFLAAGMSPGAVLIFLIAGPASNTATVTSLWTIIGAKSTIGYVLSIIATAWVFAIALDFSGISLLVSNAIHEHDSGISLFQHASAAVLILILLVARFLPKAR